MQKCGIRFLQRKALVSGLCPWSWTPQGVQSPGPKIYVRPNTSLFPRT